MKYEISLLKFKLVVLFVLISTFLITNTAFAQENEYIKYGYLKLSPYTPIDSMYVVIDSDYENYQTISPDDPIQLPAGKHNITIITKNHRDLDLNIIINEGSSIEYPLSFPISSSKNYPYVGSSYYWITNGVNVSILTDNESELYIDGKWIALGSFKVDLPLGQHDIVTRHKSGVKTKNKIVITSKKYMILDMYNQVLKNKALIWSPIPGAAQLYKKQSIKGSLLLAATTVSLVIGITSELSYKKANDKYLDSKKSYSSTESGDFMENKYNEALNYAKKRDKFLYTALGIWTINLIDAWISKPKAGYRAKSANSRISNTEINITNDAVCLHWTIHF